MRLSKLAFAALAAGLPAAAHAQGDLTVTGPYTHSAAKAVYPTQVGAFVRSNVHQFDAEGRDISASYNLRTPEGRLLVTVYIYPAPKAADAAARARACDTEFGAVKTAIANRNAGAQPLNETAPVAMAGVPASLSHSAAYRYTGRFDAREQEVRSEAHVYCYAGGDWFVKYRVSAPVAVKTDALPAFIRNGPWPGRTAQ